MAKRVIQTKIDFSKIKRDDKNYVMSYSLGLEHVHLDVANSILKKETIKWAKSNKGFDHRLINLLPEYRFITVGKYCYMLNHGAELPENVEKTFKEMMQQLNELAISSKPLNYSEEEKVEEKVEVSIRDRMVSRVGEVCAELDLYIDKIIKNPKEDIEKFDPLSKFKIENFKQNHSKIVIEFYEPALNELKMVLEGKDKDLVEAYSSYKKDHIKKLIAAHEKIIDSAKLINDTSKVLRKARKKKPVSIEKMVKKMKFKIEDAELGIASINPSEIVGSKEVWVYNTKTRKLGKYIARDEAGLGVKNSNITNFASTSFEKTLRKPAEQLKEWKNSGKVALRTFLEDIKAVDVPLKGKINDNYVILKAFK